ncbi:MAG: hypothetical protein JO056_01645 [Alphaproteobacteria bacterium]|jgi:hypothetical protein|nr:hypothetical protein [Alphaproteobacteria bacterium]
MHCSHWWRGTLLALVTGLAVSGCAGTTGSDGKPRSALERSVGTCVLSVGAGVLVDMLTNNKRLGAGTAVGAGLCAVVIAMNNEEDKRRVRESQLAALNAGKDRTDTYVGKDGNTRTIRTSVHPSAAPTDLKAHAAADGTKFVGPCRRTQTEISVQGKGSASLDPEVVCRTAQGDWLPWPGTATG